MMLKSLANSDTRALSRTQINSNKYDVKYQQIHQQEFLSVCPPTGISTNTTDNMINFNKI